MTDLPYAGAAHDPASSIRTHLFIISPNNSGSTYLRRSFEISPDVWSLPREGQHMPGFAGPSTHGSRDALIWNATPDRRARFEATGAHDWEVSRKAWYFLARARTPDASVFVTSSPPFLLVVPALKTNFTNARFIQLVRNPYAVAAGILKRPIEKRLVEGEDAVRIVADHIGNCLRDQARNKAMLGEESISFSYEEMCAQPDEISERIRALLPELTGYRLDQTIAVKGIYEEPLRNMNAEAIARLTPSVLAQLKSCFADHEEALAAHGYGPDCHELSEV